MQWLQVGGLPVNDGSLGVRQLTLACLASAASTCQLQDLILSVGVFSEDRVFDDYEVSWLTSLGTPLLSAPSSL